MAFVAVAYVVWIRIVGLEPTLAQRVAGFPQWARVGLALLLGLVLSVGAELAPTVEAGVSGVIMVAAAAFAGLLAFEVYGSDQSARARGRR